MPNEPSKDTSLFPNSDGEREDSGLQDILAVAAKIKEKPSEPEAAGDGDDGLLLFSSGTGEASNDDDDDDALFASFAGGLAFEASANSLAAEVSSSSNSVAAATPAATAAATVTPAQEEGKRNPLVAVAVVLGLALVGTAAVFLLDDGESPQQMQQAQAEMSAPGGDAVVGKAEPVEPAVEAGASAGAAVVAPEPAVEDDAGALDEEAETEGLGAMGEDAGDPMGTRANLLDEKDNGVAKGGKWDQGTSYAKPTVAEPKPEPKADPDPEPVLDLPEMGGGGGKKVTEEDVDCLLNPDLPKCNTGGGEKPKQQEILAPKLPEKLGSKELKAGFSSVKPAAKKCGLQNGVPPGTKVKVHVSIEGASGKVSSVKALGEHAGTPLGACVESAVKNAQFQPFKKPAMGIDYPLMM